MMIDAGVLKKKRGGIIKNNRKRREKYLIKQGGKNLWKTEKEY